MERTVSLDNFTLRLCHIVNPASVDLMPSPEQALPTSNRVSANHGMGGCEIKTCILWCTTIRVNELEAMLSCNLVEVGLRES